MVNNLINDFTLSVRYHGVGQMSSDEIVKIAAIVITAMCGILIGMMQCCKQSGECPCGC